MSRSPLFKISDIKALKLNEFDKAVKMQRRAENDPEHQGDKYLGGYQEHTKSTRSNVSKISKSKVETGGMGSPQKRSKGL